VHAGCQPMGGRAVPAGVDRRPLLETPGGAGRPTGVWPTAARQGCGGRGPGETPPTRSGHEPDGMAGRVPVRAPPREGGRWTRPSAVRGALATAPVDQQAGPVQVRDLPGGAFRKAQATGGDGGETPPRATPWEVCQQGADRCETAADREVPVAGGPAEGQGGPGPRPGVCIDTREAAQGHGPGTARGVRDVWERATVGPECVRGEAVGGRVVRRRQGADGPDRHRRGPCGQASEGPVCAHPLASRGQGAASWACGWRDGDIQAEASACR
jgi:hypothetical protein